MLRSKLCWAIVASRRLLRSARSALGARPGLIDDVDFNKFCECIYKKVVVNLTTQRIEATSTSTQFALMFSKKAWGA